MLVYRCKLQDLIMWPTTYYIFIFKSKNDFLFFILGYSQFCLSSESESDWSRSLLRSWCSALSLSPDRLWRSRSLSLCSERRFPKSPSTGSRIPSEKGHFKLEGMVIDCRFTNYRLIWFRPFNLFLVSKYTKLCISLNYDLQANGSIYYRYINILKKNAWTSGRAKLTFPYKP